MSRLHTDPVDVRRRDDEPAQFLWRGRLYVVREVLARWTEAGGWWLAPAVSALATGDCGHGWTDGDGGAGSDGWAGSDGGADRDGGSNRGSCAGGAGCADTAAAELLVTSPLPPSPKWAQRAWGEPAPDVGAAVGPAGVDDCERDWWRVEAGAGAAGGTGVYDLCFDWSQGSWSLARVLD